MFLPFSLNLSRAQKVETLGQIRKWGKTKSGKEKSFFGGSAFVLWRKKKVIGRKGKLNPKGNLRMNDFINLSEFAKGIYLVRVYDINQSITKKLILQ